LTKSFSNGLVAVTVLLPDNISALVFQGELYSASDEKRMLLLRDGGFLDNDLLPSAHSLHHEAARVFLVPMVVGAAMIAPSLESEMGHRFIELEHRFSDLMGRPPALPMVSSDSNLQFEHKSNTVARTHLADGKAQSSFKFTRPVWTGEGDNIVKKNTFCKALGETVGFWLLEEIYMEGSKPMFSFVPSTYLARWCASFFTPFGELIGECSLQSTMSVQFVHKNIRNAQNYLVVHLKEVSEPLFLCLDDGYKSLRSTYEKDNPWPVWEGKERFQLSEFSNIDCLSKQRIVPARRLTQNEKDKALKQHENGVGVCF
jgi:hypothetical protein